MPERFLQFTVLLILTLAGSSPMPLEAQCVLSPVAADDEIDPPPELLVLADPLANDSDPQGLPLEAAVVSSTCPGATEAEDGLVVLTLTSLLEQPCAITYSANNGQSTAVTATITVQPNAALFSDGFELGNTTAWSDTSS